MGEKTEKNFHDQLHELLNSFVHRVYDVSQKFPKEEIYGVTSQLRRATLSIMLNYIEGYARQRKAVLKNFLEISYGSLKESRYLIQFSFERKFIPALDHGELIKSADRIGAMLWGILSRL